MEGTCPPPHMGGGDKAVIEGTDGEGHILYGRGGLLIRIVFNPKR